MLQQKLIQIYKNRLLIFLLAVIAFFVNYHYGFIGIMPMDNTVLFNGGFRILKGYTPFTDYWLVTGPLLDYLNAFFFKILGISWNSFIIHSSIFNSILAVTSFLVFKKFNLNNLYSFFYSFLISLLFYPVVGTPFVDHHSTFFLILSFYSLIIAIKENQYNYYIVIPSLLSLSFLSKQTPAVYGILTITIFIFLILYKNKKQRINILKKNLIGVLIALIFISLFFYFTKINLDQFFTQYIFFASSIGEYRINEYNFNILNEISKYKFIFYFIFFLILIALRLRIKKLLSTNDTLIISISLCFALLMIFHQMISLNQNFIFFLIPLIGGISHQYYKKVFKSNYLLIFSLIICIFSVGKYHLRFNEERKFNELENIDISKAVDAKILSDKLKGLKWITYLNPDNPQKEINNLIDTVKILKKDSSNKMIVTEYQVIAPILGDYDNSPNQWHHPSVSFPLKDNKFFNTYKNYFIAKTKNKKIETIYEITENKNLVVEFILSESCLSAKKRLNKMLVKVELENNCKDLK